MQSSTIINVSRHRTKLSRCNVQIHDCKLNQKSTPLVRDLTNEHLRSYPASSGVPTTAGIWTPHSDPAIKAALVRVREEQQEEALRTRFTRESQQQFLEWLEDPKHKNRKRFTAQKYSDCKSWLLSPTKEVTGSKD